MTTLSVMAPFIGDLTGIPETRARVIADQLRRANMVSKAGRGIHAAHMTAKDAANLLLACLFSSEADATACAENVTMLRAMPLRYIGVDPADGGGFRKLPGDFYTPDEFLCFFPTKPENLGEAMDMLISPNFGAGHIWDCVVLARQGATPSAKIELFGDEYNSSAALDNASRKNWAAFAEFMNDMPQQNIVERIFKFSGAGLRLIRRKLTEFSDAGEPASQFPIASHPAGGEPQ